MKTSFIHDDFLLQTETAKRLYHSYAKHLPIVDYHCHLSPELIAKDSQFRNLTHAWLDGDHYKWRAMRALGVDENYITGDASDYEKFKMWAKVVPHTLKNPLYHWTHLELKRYFGVDSLLNEHTADEIWHKANTLLATPAYSAFSLLKKMNVHVVCSTDDAIDTLEHHAAFKSSDMVLYPTFRPDNAMKVENPEAFRSYVSRLEEVSNVKISSYATFVIALKQRHDFFDKLGCRASDHGLEEPYAEDYTEAELEAIFSKVMQGEAPTLSEQNQFKSALMYLFAVLDAEKGWAFQMHIGALRNNNTRAFRELGPDSGFDAMGDVEIARPLSKFLDQLNLAGKLPKTILYNLNSNDNEVMATISGHFYESGVPGKVQHGPGWWFHDQKEGMEQQLQSLANFSVLSNFVGMVTDSRSFLSYPRHEYFRRILCNMIGNDAENGIVPADEDMLGELIEKMCYKNAIDYFQYANLPE
ncbi:MAG: glucuronate isomerase [Bacteroidetes bacterium]|nr:glucuronate isomerase [Bacteroidota bacterium]MCH8524242.1 glucuronate isomerase [Balneolales bacterium]